MPSTSIIGESCEGLAFCVENLGCKVNKVESDTIAASLSERGGVSVSQENAGIIVVNTCTVTGEADKKTRKAVRHALSASPNAIVVVTGCAVAIDADVYAQMGDRVRVVQRASLLSEIAALHAEQPLRVGEEYRTRVSLKVQDGCNRACTYCIVHVARGPAWSVPAKDVLSEAGRYLKSGVKELVLTGIDLGSYDSEGMRLSGLVTELLELSEKLTPPGEPPARVRASSLEPHSIDATFIDLLASSEGRLCRHLHLPLQSGSSKVLREMARPYSAEQYRDLVAELYRMVPSLSLTTDIICGFPGETDEDFGQTMELARTSRFSKIHVFPYSKRAGTPAAWRLDQIDPQAKSIRCAHLRALSDELREQDLQSRAGTAEWCLVQGDKALTESYHEIEPPAQAVDGTLMRVSL